MPTNNKPKLLTYVGVIPFIFALSIACYDYFNLQSVFDFEVRFTRFKSYMIAHTYGAVIIGFLGGIQWGISLKSTTKHSYFLISNLLALMAWLSLFTFASFFGIAILVLAFLLALGIDRHAYKAELIPEWFWQLRLHISSVVILTLVLLLIINK